jgi:hypothetical protein
MGGLDGADRIGRADICLGSLQEGISLTTKGPGGPRAQDKTFAADAPVRFGATVPNLRQCVLRCSYSAAWPAAQALLFIERKSR